jgi:hypothetical protein
MTYIVTHLRLVLVSAAYRFRLKTPVVFTEYCWLNTLSRGSSSDNNEKVGPRQEK